MNTPTLSKLEIYATDLWVMLLSTVRYSMGRAGYMSSLCLDLYNTCRGVLNEQQKRQIADEIERELELHETMHKTLGQRTDHDNWQALAECIWNDLGEASERRV